MGIEVDRRQILRFTAGLAAARALPAIAAAPDSEAAPDSGPIRLSANENPYGPGPLARRAIEEAAADACRYGFDDRRAIEKLIATHHGLTRDHVLVTEGSMELLRIAGLVYGDRGELVSAHPTFGTLHSYAERFGAWINRVPLDAEMRHDLAEMERRVTNRTTLVYVCNPNNPTGTSVPPATLRGFLAAVAPRTPVLVDEAYIDLVDDPGAETMVDTVEAGHNVIISRTFSKIHGLAGMRVGYALARPDIIKRLETFRMSSGNVVGLRAAAASLGDMEFLTWSKAKIREAMAVTRRALDELALPYTPSWANFVLFDTGGDVDEFRKAMRRRSIEVGGRFRPYDTWCRVSMGTVEQMHTFSTALREHYRDRA